MWQGVAVQPGGNNPEKAPRPLLALDPYTFLWDGKELSCLQLLLNPNHLIFGYPAFLFSIQVT